MGKQKVPSRAVKLDKGPDNLRMIIKKNRAKTRYHLKKPMASLNKTHSVKAEKTRSSSDFNARSDLTGKRANTNVQGGSK